MLAVAREVQVPLLAVLLIGGCAAKARRAIGARSIDAGIGPTAMFPLPLRRPVAMAICASEFGLGIGLLVTAGRSGQAGPRTRSGWRPRCCSAPPWPRSRSCARDDRRGLRLFRRAERHAGELADHHQGSAARRGRGRLDRGAAAAHGQLVRAGGRGAGAGPGRELALLAALSPRSASSWSGSATPSRARCAGFRSPGHWHASRERPLAALPPPPDQRDADRRVARGLLAVRGVPRHPRQPPRRGGLRRLPDGPPRPGPGRRARRRHARPARSPAPLQLSIRV